jgi:hypothetical protein
MHDSLRSATNGERRWPDYRPGVHRRLLHPAAHPSDNVRVTHSNRASGTAAGDGSPANGRWHGGGGRREGPTVLRVNLHDRGQSHDHAATRMEGQASSVQ